MTTLQSEFGHPGWSSNPASQMNMQPMQQEKVDWQFGQAHPNNMGRKQELDSCGQCLKYLMFVFNLIFFLAGCSLLAVGIWIAVDRNFMSHIIGTSLFAAAAFMLIAGGAIILVISFFGCCGAIRESKCMLLSFFIALLVIFLILLVAGILALVFRTQLENSMRERMDQTLKQNYGVDLQHHWNRMVTDAWDKAQERVYCCAVLTNGWSAYRASEWYKRQPGVIETLKPLVPKTCCKRDLYGRYLDLKTCQMWRMGPPMQNGGAVNPALHYQGCYDAGKEFVWEHSSYIIGLGIGIALMMISGIVFSLCLIRNI